MSNTFIWIIFAMIAIPIIGSLISAAKTNQLQKRFSDLGNVIGINEAHIVNMVGEPTSRSVVGENMSLLQWQSQGYHIALSFTDHICTGIAHEYSS